MDKPIPKILATTSGWLIATSIVRETPKAFILVHADEPKREVRLSKADSSRKLFDNTSDAMDWMEGK
jgi:hypothetical protein